MDDDRGRLARHLCVALGRAERNHLVRARYNLQKGLSAPLGALPLEIFQYRGMVVTPVSEDVGYACFGECLQKHRRGRIQWSFRQRGAVGGGHRRRESCVRGA